MFSHLRRSRHCGSEETCSARLPSDVRQFADAMPSHQCGRLAPPRRASRGLASLKQAFFTEPSTIQLKAAGNWQHGAKEQCSSRPSPRQPRSASTDARESRHKLSGQRMRNMKTHQASGRASALRVLRLRSRRLAMLQSASKFSQILHDMLRICVSLRRRICMASRTASGTDGLQGFGQASFGAKTFSEILHQIQP